MADFYSLLTTIGKAAIANATALGSTISLTEMAVGDGNGAAVTPTEAMTSLVNEVYRAAINLLEVDDADSTLLRAELVVPTNEGGWTAREIGVFDSEGNLFAVANFPETYKPVLEEGAGRELNIVVTMQVSNTGAVVLKIDPTAVLASRGYVDDAVEDVQDAVEVVASNLSAHAARTDNPHGVTPNQIGAAPASHAARTDNPHGVTAAQIGQATTVALGVVELATSAEAVAGTDAARAVTPAALAAVLASMSQGVLCVQDQKAAGTPGGAASTATWHTRDLNAVLFNSIAGASLASNRITLPAGTYAIRASAPCFLVNRTRLKLYNFTDSTDIVLGQSALANNGVAVTLRAVLDGVFTLSAAKTLELRHYTEVGYSQGLGRECIVGVEVYAEAMIWAL